MHSITLIAMLVGALILGAGVWFLRKRLIALQTQVLAAQAVLEKHLRKRLELAAALVEGCKGIAEQKETVEAVVQAGNAAATEKQQAQVFAFHNALRQAVDELVSAVEQYRQVESDPNFRSLRAAVKDTERTIGFSAKDYNNKVRAYNDLCLMFPLSLITSNLGFQAYTPYSQDCLPAPPEQTAEARPQTSTTRRI